MDKFSLVLELLVLIANVYPKIAPAIKDLMLMIKGETVSDISQEELEARIDAAIAKLPVWEDNPDSV